MPAPIALTCGDISGIGPELIDHLWSHRQQLGIADFQVIGPRQAFRSNFGAFLIDIPMREGITIGQPTQSSATIARDALEKAAALAISRQIAAIVTAPVHKESLYLAGFDFPGQTEFFAARCTIGIADTAMMLAGPDVRTVPLTIHIPLHEVSRMLTTDLIMRQARTIHVAMQRDFGLQHPRLALAGLNPHAGENGHIGTQEIDIMLPAVQHLQAMGIRIDGPLPADSLFSSKMRKNYDAVLCAYHDQALIPVKTLDMDRTVNITLGLPIVRTSPDHGTAHDIAGKNMARPESMIEAVRLASVMAANRG